MEKKRQGTLKINKMWQLKINMQLLENHLEVKQKTTLL